MMKHLLFEMHSGISGDMILGALFDLGLDFPSWKKQVEKLKLPGIALSRKRVHKNGISATRALISAPEDTVHRHLKHIIEIIEKGRYSKSITENAVRIFTRLARAEAKVHGCSVEAVHFHEVGALDAIIDIVGACIAFDMLQVKNFYCTPFMFGQGTVKTAHGLLPVPCPATLELSRGFPSRRSGIAGELSTPTGTAIVTTLCRPNSIIPCLPVSETGYGAGKKNFDELPNVLRISIASGSEAAMPGFKSDESAFQVECNFDDISPEVLGNLTVRLFDAGCLDVWQESIFMKKNRAGIKVCALCHAPNLENTLMTIARETSTGGVRYHPVERMIAEKSIKRVKTRFGFVEVKDIIFSRSQEKIIHSVPEYESCLALSIRKKLPFLDVYQEALACTNRKLNDR